MPLHNGGEGDFPRTLRPWHVPASAWRRPTLARPGRLLFPLPWLLPWKPRGREARARFCRGGFPGTLVIGNALGGVRGRLGEEELHVQHQQPTRCDILATTTGLSETLPFFMISPTLFERANPSICLRDFIAYPHCILRNENNRQLQLSLLNRSVASAISDIFFKHEFVVCVIGVRLLPVHLCTLTIPSNRISTYGVYFGSILPCETRERERELAVPEWLPDPRVASYPMCRTSGPSLGHLQSTPSDHQQQPIVKARMHRLQLSNDCRPRVKDIVVSRSTVPRRMSKIGEH